MWQRATRLRLSESFGPSTTDSNHTFPDLAATMDDDLYDEFGNFIGEEAESEEESDHGANAGVYAYDEYVDEAPEEPAEEQMDIDEEPPSNAVILHEDKQYYPTAAQVFGEGVETLVQEEDAQPLTQPIIAPVEQKKFSIQEADLPPVYFDRGFMTDLMNFPEQIRNIALAGHLHHGKTAFMDMLVLETHAIQERLDKRTGKKRDEQLRYTDVHVIERDRGLSIKAAPMSLVLSSTKGKSHLFNIIDTPGHVDFVDEVAAAFRLVDGVCLVVDVVEGVQVNTEQIIKHAVLEDIPLTLIINKMDRLILELKIPPTDAYFKLKHVIEEVNTVIENTIPGRGESKRLSPEKGNVLFACTSMGWCFTLQSFAKMYSESYGGVNVEEFARRLWGDVYFNPKKRTFTRKPIEEGAKRSFVNFVMEPIYKLYSHTISEGPEDLKRTLSKLGIFLKPSQYKADPKVLMKLVCEQFFGPSTAFVDMVIKHIPSPLEAAEKKLERYYTGPLDTKIAESMKNCDQNGPLVVHVTKLFNTIDAKSFYAFGRVMSGIARPGADVRVLGEGYTLDDEEDMVVSRISDVFIAETRYNIPTDGVPAGNFVLLGGVDNSIVKTATIVDKKFDNGEDAYVFKPLSHFTESVLKVAVEPINPSELPKMLDGIRKINKSYPLITTKVEESGEHIILGTGELYMDCVLHDLRKLYADMEVRVSDPVVRFCETVQDMSATKCYAITPNKKNTITMAAEPLDDGIAQDIESGAVKIKDPPRKVAKFFEEKYGWDKLAARSIWAFGPDEMGPNILQDDTLPTEVDKKRLATVKESIRQGFAWATREGPLCEEPIRNTKFRLIDVSLAQEAIFRVSMTGPQSSVSMVYNILSRRRGHVLSDGPIAGTPLYRVNGLIPVIDSFGFETDLRINTPGQAMVSLVFDRWSIVPGDPLDREQVTRPLQMATAQATARDFVLKTRRRKGLSEDVTVAKFLEPEFYQSLLESGTLGEP
ncbi:116 kda u5 small nuclear ribonucleoprotein component-like protein [Thermochaetoides thermophila DSM 1495]|uniref:116 kDa u5 small nuclear ribonucleoprotein component-like protein n=1 Tax=Chaetomium thermophilum (strain DSM 1495 / CBS 144.50 / IMI 039719) TaxID=759272 RepID=G0SBV2_CHATD|nr:116 kda u5 small nuclear ribonucleoprotein component-like protein [Thermochaetoides thermophila DSM 1495]EGS18878.1 116 kda u5 small nuclear ribonucleoprotein component-like protein [Thermochaetoides thermophila DSM 1495]